MPKAKTKAVLVAVTDDGDRYPITTNGHSSISIGELIDINLLKPSATNPRRRFPQASISELAGSLAEQGVIEPLIVRPKYEINVHQAQTKLWYPQIENGTPHPVIRGTGHEKEEDAEAEAKGLQKFEIVCGERRYRAAQYVLAAVAGSNWAAAKDKLRRLPCIVRPLTDEQVLDIQIHENLHREDVHPMDEAFGYKFLQDKLACDVKELALRVGKTESYVLNRLKLNQLIKEAQDDIDAGVLPLVYALEIAKYPAETQVTILKKAVFETNQYHDSVLGKWVTPKRGEKLVSFNSFQSWIRNNVLYQLSTAVFDLKATDLREDGLACVNCPSRTGAAASLFPGTGKKDSCLDPACFNRKIEAHILVTRDLLAEKSKIEPHQIPIINSQNWQNDPKAVAGKPIEIVGYEQAIVIGKAPKGVYFSNSTTKTCSNSTAGVDVNKNHFAQTVTVCLKSSKCSVHWKEQKAATSSTKSKGSEKSTKEKEQFYGRKEEIWNVKIGEAVRLRVIAFAGEKFAKTFSVKGGGDLFIPAMCSKLWELYLSDYTKRRVRDNIAKPIVAAAMNVEAHKIDLSASHNDGGIGTETKIAKLPENVQKLLLFALIHGHKGDMGQGSWISQKGIFDMAIEWKIDYRLIDAEVRLKLSAKKHQPAHKIYLDEVRAGKKSAARPWLYSEKWKPGN